MFSPFSTLREVFAFVSLSNGFSMLLQFFAAVKFFLLIGVRQMFPHARKRSAFAICARLRFICIKVSRADYNSSIFVFEVLFALNVVGHVLIFHFVGFVWNNFSWLKRQFVTSF